MCNRFCFSKFIPICLFLPHLGLFPGFAFSDVEPSALVQHQGGPCAVIAPVQAFLLQCLLADSSLRPPPPSGGAAFTFNEVCTYVHTQLNDCANVQREFSSVLDANLPSHLVLIIPVAGANGDVQSLTSTSDRQHPGQVPDVHGAELPNCFGKQTATTSATSSGDNK